MTPQGSPDPVSVRRVFSAACELPSDRRAAWLDVECAGAPHLRTEVEDLLAHFDRAPDFLAQEPKERSGAERQPVSIGPYRILGRLGSGGMGVVYRAQEDLPRRQVAVKVLRLALAGEHARARFAHEIEALGRLHHPAIAQIYAAGVWDSELGSQPYFAMELVEGLPLTEYARARSLPIAERCRLFVQVCEAAHHAHDQGIVHRDLKPSNVLVSEGLAGAAHVKILDFGIARSLRGEEDSTMLTRTGDVLGTLAYMSPERFEGDPSTVDARSDVYALGVMLYELLVDRLPLAVENRSLAEAARVVLTQEPVRLGRLDAALRGDLETIVATALNKEPGARYPSAAALSADLQRWLRHEPIRARPQTAFYHLRRFARRNRVLVAGALATTVALVAGLVGTTLFANREARERARAEAAAVELRHTLYGSQMLLAGGAVDAAGGLARARNLIEAWRPAPGETDLRGFEWRWIDAMANAQERTVESRRELRRLWCPPGGAVFALTHDGMIRLDAETLQERDVVVPGEILEAVVRADGRQLLVADGSTLRAFELPSASLQWSIPALGHGIGLCYANDDRFALGLPENAERGAARIEWRGSADGELRRVIPVVGEQLDTAMAFSADGRRFAYSTRTPNALVLVGLPNEAGVDLGNWGGVSSLAFEPGGERIAVGNSRGSVYLLPLAPPARAAVETKELRGHRAGEVFEVHWSTDGRSLASGGEDGEVWLWDAATNVGRLLGAHDTPVVSCTWNADRTHLVSASHDRLRTWPVRRPSARRDLGREAGHGGGPMQLTADGSLCVGGGPRAVKLTPESGAWLSSVRDTRTGAVVQEEPGETICLHDARRLVAFCHRGVLRIRALGEAAVLAELDTKLADGPTPGLAWDPAGEALAIAGSHEILVWRPFAAKPPLRAACVQVKELAWHPEGRRLAALASAPESVLVEFVVESERLCERRNLAVGSWIRCLAWSPDGSRLAFAGRDGFVEVRDGEGSAVLRRFHAHSQRVSTLAWSPDGSRLVTGGGDLSVRLFETLRFQEVLMLAMPAEVVSVAWSADGQRLAAACRFGKALLFDAGVKGHPAPSLTAADRCYDRPR